MPLKFKKPGAPTSTVSKAVTEVKGKGVKEVLAENTVTKQEDPAPSHVVGQAGTLEPLCEVGMEASYTHNLGNFQSARVQVSLKVPCLHKEIDSAYAYAKEWVDAKIGEMKDELEGDG